MHFKEGLAAVLKDDKWGYINKEGKIVISLKYDETTGEFFEGKTGVKLGEKWGEINKRGKITIPIKESSDPDYFDY